MPTMTIHTRDRVEAEMQARAIAEQNRIAAAERAALEVLN